MGTLRTSAWRRIHSSLLRRATAHSPSFLHSPLLSPLLAGSVRALSIGSSPPVQNNKHNQPAFSVVYGEAAPSLPDPYAIVSSQLRPLDESLHELVGSDHPVLARVVHHFFELAGKRFRPTVVLLAARAANGGAEANASQVPLAFALLPFFPPTSPDSPIFLLFPSLIPFPPLDSPILSPPPPISLPNLTSATASLCIHPLLSPPPLPTLVFFRPRRCGSPRSRR